MLAGTCIYSNHLEGEHTALASELASVKRTGALWYSATRPSWIACFEICQGPQTCQLAFRLLQPKPFQRWRSSTFLGLQLLQWQQ